LAVVVKPLTTTVADIERVKANGEFAADVILSF
jgi:hypothetical protein